MKQWKKAGVLVSVICMLLSLPYPGWGSSVGTAHAAVGFVDGDGSEGDPFQIATAEQLNEIRNHLDKHFVLIQDIDLRTDASTVVWEPIANFSGSLQGEGNTITHLNIQKHSNDVGLFANVITGGHIENVFVDAVEVRGWDHVGILVGRNTGATVMNVSVSGAVYGDNYVGGLIGRLENSNITNSVAEVDVTAGWDFVGGLIGRSEGSKVAESAAEGTVTSNRRAVGGLIGISRWTEISNSSASGNVSGQDEVAGLIGRAEESVVSNSSASNEVKGRHFVGGLIGVAWEDSDISESYAEGSVSGVGQVGGLIGVLSNSKLSNSSATGRVTGEDHRVGGLIGRSVESNISNSTATGSVTGARNYVGGLIGNSEESNVSHSSASSAVAGKGDYVGGFIGYANTSNISDSSASGSVVSEGGYVGGLVGESRDSEISDSFASGDVKANLRYIGGFIGRNRGGDVSNSYATGAVVGDFGPVAGDFGYVGGLIGRSSDGDDVKDSFATGDVTANGDYIGGFIGYAVGRVSNSYATGQIVGESYVGGLIGDFRNGEISNSFAEGTVTGGRYVGGLAGFIMDGRTSNSFASGDVRGHNSAGGLIGEFITGTITESYATGSVTGSGNEGGLVGSFQQGDVSLSYATGEVTGLKNTGGLIGELVESTVTYSYAEGNVAGEVDAGGFVGGNRRGDVAFSFAAGNVSGCDDIGGFVGDNDLARISNSYVAGNVTGICGTGLSYSVGGLVGDNSGTIENSFVMGSVTGHHNVGGLVGDNRFAVGNITNSYYDMDVTGQSDLNGQGLTSEQMKNMESYEGWDFDTTWKIDQHHYGYPYLIEMEGMQAFLTYMGNNSNDDHGLYVSKPYKTGSFVTIEDLHWTREGYLFQGWDTAPDGNGVRYEIGDSIELTSSLLLYAAWNQDEPPKSDDAKLARLVISAGGQTVTLSPAFETGETSYRAETTSSEATIEAIPSDERATVSLEGERLDEEKTVLLVEGDNWFELVVTAENGEIETYNLTIHRVIDEDVPTTPENEESSGSVRSQSTNANLAHLNVIIDGKELVLSPKFALEETRYRVETTSSEATIQVTPSDVWATVTLEGERVEKEKTVVLVEGDNVFEIVVKAENGTRKTYSLTIHRVVENEDTPTTPDAPGCTFSDVTGHWAELFICEAFERGIVKGHTETRFSPQSGITRVEFMAILLRTLGMASTASEWTEHGFVDQDQIPAWATATVQIAVENGLLQGYPDQSLRPLDNVSRAEMVTMIGRAMEWGNLSGNTTFHDDADIPHWAKGYIREAVARGLLNGRGDNRFSPLESATRSEASVLLLKLWYVLDESNSESGD